MTIRMSSVSKAFGSRRVLDRFSLSVRPGEVYGLVGPNGAGKTTAINILCGLLEADHGQVSVAASSAGSGRKRALGVAPQEIAVYRHLSVKENLEVFSQLYGHDRRESRRRAAETIEALQFGEFADHRVETLSGGWQRRVNVAVALVHGPAALVLDEPSAGLDIEARNELWELIERCRAREVAILVTTHQLDEAERVCSRVGILDRGRIAAEGSLVELRGLVPAECVAVVDAQDPAAIRTRAEGLGWSFIVRGGRQILFLPERIALAQVVESLDGCGLQSVRLRDITLEDVYLEVADGERGRRAA